jgi:hypothetical protein
MKMKLASSPELLQGHRPSETGSALPLNDYKDRGERLQKTHAQSSAETSGLGDSLQRIHTLSSTETSGYGDAGARSPSVPPSPSPESTLNRGGNSRAPRYFNRASASAADLLYESSSDLHHNPAPAVHSSGAASVYHSALDILPPNPSPRGSPAAVHGSGNMGRSRGQVAAADAGERDHGGGRGHPNSNPNSINRNNNTAAANNQRGRYDTGGYGGVHGNEMIIESANFDSLFAKSSNRAPTNRDPRNGIGNNNRMSGSQAYSDSMDATNYNDSLNYSPGHTPPLSRSNSSTRRSTLFLGAHSDSTWLKWSQDRRASFKKRLDNIERRQKDLENNRVTTPVKKARKESLMFVSPELESEHIPRDDDYIELGIGLGLPPNPDSEQSTTLVPISAKKKKQQECMEPKEVKLTMNQWNTLIAFWEHDCFVRCRYGGLLLCAIALILTVISATSRDWSHDFGE